jgi:geranylgeranyl transferase type-2 subunit alpha
MHGQRKKDFKAESYTAKQTQDYLELVRVVFEMRDSKSYNLDSLIATTKLLEKNPEFYTVWNFRKLIFRNFQQCQINVTDLLKFDLKFTLKLLKKHPKSYWIFNHRKWITFQLSSAIEELSLVNLMLDLDSRNFHGWDYRRTLGLDARQEFDYTTLKLTQNFSNWSAVRNLN